MSEEKPKEKVKVYYARCPYCDKVVIGQAKSQTRSNLAQHMLYKHGVATSEFEVKAIEVEIDG